MFQFNSCWKKNHESRKRNDYPISFRKWWKWNGIIIYLEDYTIDSWIKSQLIFFEIVLCDVNAWDYQLKSIYGNFPQMSPLKFGIILT